MTKQSIPKHSNPIVATYSKLADEYDAPEHVGSCWGRVTTAAVGEIELKDTYRTVIDIGCGTGWALNTLALGASSEVQFIGFDPAEKMRHRAMNLTNERPNIRILDGSFESIPLDDDFADYLYSTLAFHWCVDIDRAVAELARVLKPTGEMDLVFIGRNNGREFIHKTSPIFLKYMGPKLFLESAGLRKQLERDAAETLFQSAFPSERLTVRESYYTYHDTLEGHWNWWCRIEGHFIRIPLERKAACDAAVKAALADLTTERGIPYTVHLLHVKLRDD